MKSNWARLSLGALSIAIVIAAVMPNLANAAGFVRKVKTAAEVIKETMLKEMRVDLVEEVESFCGSEDAAKIYAVSVPEYGRDESGQVVETGRKVVKTFAVTKMDEIYGRTTDTQACGE